MWLYSAFRSLRPVFALYWRFRVEGEASIPREPFILVSNHESFIDPWYYIVLFPRRLRFLINRNWFYKNAFWHWFCSSHGSIPLQDGRPDATMDGLREALERGHSVAVFPEGRISHDGRIQRFRSGVAYLAGQTGAPVLPVGINGAYESLPRSRRFPRPATVTLRVGTPIRFPGSPCEGRPSRQEIADFTQRLYDEVSSLADQPIPVAEPEPGQLS